MAVVYYVKNVVTKKKNNNKSNTRKNHTREQINKSNQKRIETNKAKYGVSHVSQLEKVKQK